MDNDIELKYIKGNETFGGFGEGFTIEEYELSARVVTIFIQKKVKVLPKNDLGWKKKDWDMTPFDNEYSEILLMCLGYSNGDIRLETELDLLKTVLEKSKVFYSFYYKPNKDNPTDVRLFVLDTETRRLYVIESNI